jgi:hypothetical protein
VIASVQVRDEINASVPDGLSYLDSSPHQFADQLLPTEELDQL